MIILINLILLIITIKLMQTVKHIALEEVKKQEKKTKILVDKREPLKVKPSNQVLTILLICQTADEKSR